MMKNIGRNHLSRFALLLGQQALLVPISLILAGVLLLDLSLIIPFVPVRAVISLVCALCVPGYSLTLLIFGPEERWQISVLVPLCIILSIAFIALLSIALHFMFLPLTTRSIVLGMNAAVAIITFLAVRLKGRRPHSTGIEPTLAFRTSVAGIGKSAGIRLMAVFGLAALLSLLIIAVESKRLSKPAADQFTQFYLNGSWGRINQIVNADPGKPLRVQLGLRNQTQQSVLYHIVPQVDGTQAWGSVWIRLEPDQSWTGIVLSRVPQTGCLHRVAFDLHVGSQTMTTAELVLWAYGSIQDHALCERQGQ